MQVSASRIDDLTWHFDVAIPALEIERKISDKISELTRTMQLPGFRPGKVPSSLIRKKYGLAIRGEVLEETINASSASVLSERGLRPATEPKIEVTSADEGADLAFRIAVESLPDIPEVDFSAIGLEQLVTETEDAAIEETLRRLAESSAPWDEVTEPRPARLGDKLVIDVCRGPDEEPVVTPDQGGVEVELGGRQLLPGLEEVLVGAMVGERRTFELNTPPLGDQDSPPPEGASSITVQVRTLLERQPMPVDEELATRLGVESLDALRTVIRERQNANYAEAARQKLKRDLLDQLDTLVSFPLPRSIVDQELAAITKQLQEADDVPAAVDAPDADGEPSPAGEPAPDAEQQRLAERRVRLALLFADVARRNSLRVDEDEVAKAVVNEARRYPGQEREVMNYFRDHPEAREALSGPILEDKVVDFIVGRATVAERRLSVEDFIAIQREAAAGMDGGEPAPAADGAGEGDGGSVDGVAATDGPPQADAAAGEPVDEGVRSA